MEFILKKITNLKAEIFKSSNFQIFKSITKFNHFSEQARQISIFYTFAIF